MLLLDDDAELTRLLEGVLEADGIFVVPFVDPADAVSAAVTGPWIAALVSLDLAEGAGESFLEVLSDLEHVSLPVVLTSGEHREQSDHVQAVMARYGVPLFLRKPIPLLDLQDMLHRARQHGGQLDAFAALGANQSVSVDLGLSDTNQVEFTPASVTVTVTDVDVGSRRRQALKGVLGGLERGRGGVEGLVELSDADLEPLDEREDLAPVAGSFELEIEDDESEDVSVHMIFPERR